jgi:ElaB/YqjD/DUF883 family membrane-anchored ribosome-binding protein
MTSSDPEVIRQQIEQTRSNLSTDVNTLADTVNPVQAAKRRTASARFAVTRFKDRVMGSASQTTYGASSAMSGAGSSARSTVGGAMSNVSDAASNVGDKMSDVGSTVGSAVSEAPQVIRSQAQGNPLAAGLIALGVGWLVGSLLPASEPEQQAATRLKETAAPAVAGLAKETAGQLREPAQQAVESVKDTAAGAATTVKEEGKSAAQDVAGTAQDAKETVRAQRS